jgi:hypothetical protein
MHSECLRTPVDNKFFFPIFDIKNIGKVRIALTFEFLTDVRGSEHKNFFLLSLNMDGCVRKHFRELKKKKKKHIFLNQLFIDSFSVNGSSFLGRLIATHFLFSFSIQFNMKH